MEISLKQLAISLTLLALGGGAGLIGSRFLPEQNRPYVELKTVPVALSPGTIVPNQSLGISNATGGENINFIATAAQKVGPAVVRINATRKVANQIPEAFKTPLFRHFFGDDQAIPQDRIERGTGSGFIVRPDGEIVTNAHVVADTDTVQVTLKDGRSFEGKVLGVDPVIDIAVVKITADKLPSVKLGNSHNLIPGQWAIAIGNPLGLDNTVTVGIISAVDRTSAQVGIPDKRVNFIQTDASINPGNSGGPLLNAQGEVIGVNTAIRADARGLGFAIPIEIAARVANQLYSTGRVEHPFLGIQMVDLTSAKKDEINKDTKLNIKADKGVLIARVMDKSPAEKGGLQAGDLIQKINRQLIRNSADVQQLVESSSVGAVLQIEISRHEKTQILKVESGAFPNE